MALPVTTNHGEEVVLSIYESPRRALLAMVARGKPIDRSHHPSHLWSAGAIAIVDRFLAVERLPAPTREGLKPGVPARSADQLSHGASTRRLRCRRSGTRPLGWRDSRLSLLLIELWRRLGTIFLLLLILTSEFSPTLFSQTRTLHCKKARPRPVELNQDGSYFDVGGRCQRSVRVLDRFRSF